MELIGVIGPILDRVTYSFSHLKRQIDYVRNIRENFHNLKENAEELDIRKKDINEEINRDVVSKKPSAECEAWLKKVQEIENQMNEMEAELNENKTCVGGWCSQSRFRLGKHILDTAQKIIKMIEASEFKGGVVVINLAPMIVEQIPTPVIQGNTSIDRTVQKVLKCISDENITKIGVHGMGGVGKTTVMKTLNNLPEISQMFQIVIWLTVSKDWSLANVQQQIAARLSLNCEENEYGQIFANKLYQKLKTMKYLFLLDDVWDTIDLGDVGVPTPTRENSCKIVLTTRSLLVCKKMSTDEDIKVEVLSKEEAWGLFRNKVGDIVDDPLIHQFARDVVEECDGLPLAIIVTGGSLRKEKDEHVWSNALRELKSATFELHDMEESVFMRLKFSYDRLKGDNIKSCFLYCSLYPEDYEIEAAGLIEHWWAEGLIDGMQNLREAYDKGYSILNDLTNMSLLERIEGGPHLSVKMHDVIRDLSLRITSPKNGEHTLYKFLVKARSAIEELPNVDEWRQAGRISMMYTKLQKLPNRPECPLLSTLLLQGTLLQTIPDFFFVQMPSLRVLNLSHTGITSLPMQVGQLNRLEMLHLESSYYGGIVYLPSEVGQLTRLRSLRVTFDSNIDSMLVIPSGLLASLFLLEDLRISLSLRYNKNNGKRRLCQVATTTEEVANLKYLIHLEFPFARKGDLEHFLERSCCWKDKRLQSFKFLVGDDLMPYSIVGNYGGTQIFKLDAENVVPSTVAIKKVLGRCSAFALQHHRTIKMLSDVVNNRDDIQRLAYCSISECDVFETFVDVSLPNLDNLRLIGLPQLRAIWNSHQSLTSLRCLYLKDCGKLTNLFSWSMHQKLSNLEDLTIIQCQGIEEIVNEEVEGGMVVKRDDEAVQVVLFPRLKKLRLYYLPNLVSICKGIPNQVGWPSVILFHISGCRNLKKFPLSISNAPSLTAITGNKLEWWESLEWGDDDITKQQLPLLYKGQA